MTSVMDKDRANAILKAFGPCTWLYECTDSDELIKEFEEFKGSESGFCQLQVDVEDIRAERESGASESGGAEIYKGWKEQKKGVIFRLRELGIEVDES